jgi:hypothetical protein
MTSTLSPTKTLPVEDQASTLVDDRIHTLCENCIGEDPPWGTPATTYCGRLEIFDHWDAPDAQPSCEVCDAIRYCPVCGYSPW